MSNLTDISYIKGLLNEFDTGLKKKFGQNFLINPTIPIKIAAAGIINKNYGVLEIGPGIGVLTSELAKNSKFVVAVEIDENLLPILDKTLFEFDNIKIINNDMQKLNIKTLVEENFSYCEGVCVCANLPYYITTPILMNLLECSVSFARITVMVQSEVADRLTAAPGSACYGAITASIAYRGLAKKILNVPSGNFLPAPRVDSAVVSIDIYRKKPFVVKDEKVLFKVIKGAFGQRRKTLSNALCTQFSYLGKEFVSTAISNCDISPTIRGEMLSIEQFCKIADKLTIEK